VAESISGVMGMIHGGEYTPGPARGTGAHGPGRRRRWGTSRKRPLASNRRFFYGYGIASLVLLVVAGTWSLGSVGCTFSGTDYSRQTGAFFTNLRQSPAQTARLIRNAYYYKLMGRPEVALKELEQAHQQDPNNLKIVNALAKNYEELGKYQAARQLYQETLDRYGPNPVLANNLCFTYYEEGRLPEAEKCFRQTLARDPGNEAARNNLGLLYCRLGRRDEARRLWQKADGVAVADYKLGQALAALGLPAGPVYAQKPAPVPAAAGASSAPTARARRSLAPTPTPVAAKPRTEARLARLARPVTPKATERQVALKPALEKPSPVTAKPQEKAQAAQPVPPITSAQQVASKPAAPTPSPVAAKPRAEARLARLARPVTPKATARQVALKPAQEKPSPVTAKPRAEAQAAQPVPPITSVQQVASKPAAPTPTPVAAKPRAETQQQAAVTKPASPAAALSPAPQAAVQSEPPHLTYAELVGTPIEIQNGTWSHYLAHKTRARLTHEGFTVAKIGNYIDFGAKKTIIFYRPEAERVAQALNRRFFPGAAVKPSQELRKGIDVKILLGQAETQLARQAPPVTPKAAAPLAALKPAAPTPSPVASIPRVEARLTPPAPPVTPQAAASLAALKPAAPTPSPVTAKPQAETQQQAAVTKPSSPAAALSPAPQAAVQSEPPYLTYAELVGTPIEIQNGTWSHYLAHKTRARLTQEGFTVAKIGNYIDFGVKKTMIYYRPGAERVARALNRRFFPIAAVEPSQKLHTGMDVKILLGADLQKRPQLMARLSGVVP